METCSTCRFWQPKTEKAETAECRRSAPLPQARPRALAYWPITKVDAACGEHQKATTKRSTSPSK